MGRIYTEIRENGRKLWTLFDTGSRNTYITHTAAAGIPQQPIKETRRVGLGGRVRTFDRMCSMTTYVEGKSVDILAYVIDELGADEHGRPIEVIFGALEMQRWGIVPVPHKECLDLTHYPEEFIEF